MNSQIKPSEVSDVLLQQLRAIDTSLKFDEVGTVLQVSDGVARIYGLNKAEAEELLEFENGVMAIVMNLEEDNVGAVLLGPTDLIKEGMTVKRTGRIASIQVGEGMLGRVINPIGQPIDGAGEIIGSLYEMPLERKSPGVIFRQPVTEPLQTGLKAIDSMIPIGRGQRELIIGDRQTGKTSIAISVAKAMNRKLSRLSLGGVRDEADIRGHRKTYIGAMPGRIIDALIRAGSMNPLLVLDEIDKLANDSRGDPASALLEVLDAEQNGSFRDHFMELPVDLSRVMFITTANTLDTIPRPLLDRMEVIELSSYTDEEKMEIAKRHLLPKQLKEHGLKKSQLRISEAALRHTITDYTRESGVRVLERQLGKLCRKAAMALVESSVKSVSITDKNLGEFLGTVRYTPGVHITRDEVGVVNGLAWTEVGGEILEVEVNVMEGTGKLELTGNLGTVMQESAKAALSCIRSRSDSLRLEKDFYKTKDIHIHFPEAATPKDGPSAGIAITTAMLSALTGRLVRGDVAMTGEVTLRGRVLPIGGLKEKTMAALRNGIKTVLIPMENKKDLQDIDPVVRKALHFIPVETVDAVFAAALVPESQADAVEHMTLTADTTYTEVRHGNQL